MNGWRKVAASLGGALALLGLTLGGWALARTEVMGRELAANTKDDESSHRCCDVAMSALGEINERLGRIEGYLQAKAEAKAKK